MSKDLPNDSKVVEISTIDSTGRKLQMNLDDIKTIPKPNTKKE